jgi:hypothetical protein
VGGAPAGSPQRSPGLVQIKAQHMRLNKAVFCLVSCLSFAFAGQAQTTNILDWQFSTGDNPAEPTPGTTINPDEGAPSARFTGSSINYSFFPRQFYSTPEPNSIPSGTWEIDSGQLQLSMDRSAVGPVSYTLQVFQFVTVDSFFSGHLSLSPASDANNLPVSRVVYVPQTAGMIGSWYEDTYSWSAVNLNPSISLSLTGADGPIMLDEIKLTIVGTLVPEPSFGLIAAAGLLAFGIRSWLRRKA